MDLALGRGQEREDREGVIAHAFVKRRAQKLIPDL